MSYILEALKKSSEERSRLTTVGACAEPAPVSPERAVRAAPSLRRSLVVPGLFGLMAIAIAAIVAYRPPSLPQAEPERSPLAAASPERAQENRQLDESTAAVTPKTLPAKKNVPPSTFEAAPAKAPAKATPEPVVKPSDGSGTSSAMPVASSVTAVAPVSAPAPNAVAVAPAPSAGTDMPPELLKQVLAVPISAHVYSSKPAERMVIIDGRAVREGDVLASGMTVEQITSSGIAVSYKGYRTNKPVGR